MIREVARRAVTTALAVGSIAGLTAEASTPRLGNPVDRHGPAPFSDSRVFGTLSPGRLVSAPGDPNLHRAGGGDSDPASAIGPGWTVERIGDASGAFTLVGPPVALPAGATAESLLAIAKKLPGLFGVDARSLQAAPSAAAAQSLGEGTTRQLRQLIDGAPVQGALVRGHFDREGRLLSIDARLRTRSSVLNTRDLTSALAAALAGRALAREHPTIELLGAARTEAWLAPSRDGLAHVWTVRQATAHPRWLFLTTVDAQTGEILDQADGAQRALRVGRGLVCPVDATSPEEVRLVNLRNLLGARQNPSGLLSGLHVQVDDTKGASVASSSLRYEFGPNSAPDAFDQVSAYYHFERAHRHWARDLGVHGVPWFDDGQPLPVQVNDEDTCGAFYSPDVSGEGTPGFVFADQNTCGYEHADYARDGDVIQHEFTHGVLDWSGITIAEAPMNSYQRAISEGDADYHAACASGDPVIGELVQVERSVANAKLYPDDVGCDAYGFREEHCTGEIWSGFLWDLQTLLGPRAEKLELASLDYLVDNWPDGHLEGIFDFWDGAVALLRADRDLNDGRDEGLIYGAAASRGFFGPNSYPDDQISIVCQTLTRRSRFRSLGWVHEATQRVPFYFTAPMNADVTIKVRSTAESGLEPTLVLSQTNGLTRVPIASSGNAIPKGMSLESTLPGTALYVVEVVPMNGTSGAFEVTISVR